ncbi:MAG: phosphate ABC transporter permease subunit PstC, partial [Oligoflexia bacterium]|nr:phosphate ABC transporter permease subunit PstC [Oligoflexia bacterium]
MMKLSAKLEERLGISLMYVVVLSIIILIFIMFILLFKMSLPSISKFGFYFIVSKEWNPVEEQFGAWPFIYGTILTSILSLIIALPFGVSSAIFITEIGPKRLRIFLGTSIDLIAAIPSIIFGMWGLFYLVPFIRDTLTPILKNSFGFLPFFQGASFGISLLAASLILSIMIIPIISSLCRELFLSVPVTYKEAALALGATPFEKIKLAVLRPSITGIVGASGLALARALGETMAVVMVIGNSPQVSLSLFYPGATMASILANEYAEATTDLHLASLCYMATLLFLVTMIVNSLSHFVIKYFKP